MSTHAATADPESFWEFQFAPSPTRAQVAFDVAFGIALPLLCVCFDPIVFRSSFGEPILDGYRVVAGGAIGIGLLSLGAWLSFRKPSSLLAGGALFAALLGFVLLPFSLGGLVLALIGILGFSPFITAFVFWRNAVRAYRKRQRGFAANATMVLGLVIACGGPPAAHVYVKHEASRALEMLQSDDPATVRQGVAVLKRFHLANKDGLVFAYESEEDHGRRARLAETYRELTGSDIEERLAILRD